MFVLITFMPGPTTSCAANEEVLVFVSGHFELVGTRVVGALSVSYSYLALFFFVISASGRSNFACSVLHQSRFCFGVVLNSLRSRIHSTALRVKNYLS